MLMLRQWKGGIVGGGVVPQVVRTADDESCVGAQPKENATAAGAGRVAAATHVVVAACVAFVVLLIPPLSERTGVTEAAAALGYQFVGRMAGAVRTPPNICSSNLT